ncbi:DUF111 family protein, partial [bacterium]|nr:DUF111 family protein [bacterium]
VLTREIVELDSPWGPFRVKVSGTGESRRIRPEYDDIARIAREREQGFSLAAEELTRVARDRLGETR